MEVKDRNTKEVKAKFTRKKKSLWAGATEVYPKEAT